MTNFILAALCVSFVGALAIAGCVRTVDLTEDPSLPLERAPWSTSAIFLHDRRHTGARLRHLSARPPQTKEPEPSTSAPSAHADEIAGTNLARVVVVQLGVAIHAHAVLRRLGM